MGPMTLLPTDHHWTVADLDDLPDDGLRYELVDGTLLVSAAPSLLHQRALGNLHLLLRASCPPHLEVFLAPTDYQPTPTRSFQPDLLVVRRQGLGKAVTTPLALAVEIISPSSRSVDAVLKRALYEQSGVESYWLVDPEVPSVTAWTLEDGAYGTPVTAAGEQPWDARAPFPLTVTPAVLIR